MDIDLLWAHINYRNFYLVQHCDICPRANYVQDIGCQRDDGDRRLLGSNRNVHVRYCSCMVVVCSDCTVVGGGCGGGAENFGAVDSVVGSAVGVTTFGSIVGGISDVGVVVASMCDVGDVAIAADGAGVALDILVWFPMLSIASDVGVAIVADVINSVDPYHDHYHYHQ